MAAEISISPDAQANNIKIVPDDATTRQAIRSLAAQVAGDLDRLRLPSREDLERGGQTVLDRLQLPGRFLGFAMVAVSNAFWRPVAEATAFDRRLFLLPHCLRDRAACAGSYDSIGLNCAGCGSCEIHRLKSEAERLGYTVVVAEGTSSVLFKVLEGDVDMILGVACLDSLEKSFQHLVELGVPHMAVPLLKDGCLDTEVELDQVHALLTATTVQPTAAPRGYLPLLRETTRMFRPPRFAELLGPYAEPADCAGTNEGATSVEHIALDWLREGGKRLRPFVTIACYAVARHGVAVLDCSDEIYEKIPLPVWRLALAIESLHKASLVHDDIEDDDEYRYGRPTLHRVYGVAQAVNVGDYLIGLGYRLVAGETASLGADCGGDILNRLSQAHLELCRGQGAELQLRSQPPRQHRPAEVMEAYAQKTAPAFEVALYAGLRAAGTNVDPAALRRFSTYLGEGFQIRNDLDDWRQDDHNKRKLGPDALADRPTILRLFAAGNGCASELAELARSNGRLTPTERLSRVFEIYHRSGAFAKTEELYQKLRDRALQAAADFPTADLRELMRFMARMVLRELDQLPPPVS